MREKEFRVIGNAPEESKVQEKRRLETALFDHKKSLSPEDQKMLDKFELEQTSQEQQILEWANEATNKLMKAVGAPGFTIPPENFHILPPEKYQEITSRENAGMTYYIEQGILLNASRVRRGLISLASTAIHEMLHLKSHQTVQINRPGQSEKNVASFARIGIEVISDQPKLGKERHSHFSGLNEAIVTRAEALLLRELLNQSFMKDEKSKYESEQVTARRREIAEKRQKPVEEIVFIFEEGWDERGYLEQRKVLQYVCEQIQIEFPEQYATTEDVFQEFLKAHFTGQLLPLARLMKKAFGKHGFRMLGAMTPDQDSAINCLELLQKARLEVKKQKKV